MQKNYYNISIIFLLIIVTSLSYFGCIAPIGLRDVKKYQKNDDWDQVVKLYQEAIESEPDNHFYRAKLIEAKEMAAYMHYEKGENYYKSGQVNEAITEFDTALRLNPYYERPEIMIDKITGKKKAKRERNDTIIYRKGMSGRMPALIEDNDKDIIPPNPPLPKGELYEPFPFSKGGLYDPPPLAKGGRGDLKGIFGLNREDENRAIEDRRRSEYLTTRRQELDDFENNSSQSLIHPSPDIPVLSIFPPSYTARIGEEFSVEVRVDNIHDLFSSPFYLTYNPEVIEFVDIQEGNLLKSDGKGTSFMKSIRPDRGEIIVGISRLGDTGGINGSGILAVARFRAKRQGEGNISLNNVNFMDRSLTKIPVTAKGGVIRVR